MLTFPWAALLLTLFPLTVSPGPANLLLASAGTSFGLRRSIPFMVGTYAVFAMQCLILGAGVGEIVYRNPAIITLLQYVGAAYLVYLAYHFFQSAAIARTQSAQRLDLKEGVIVALLNFKSFIVQGLMFSLFLDPSQPRWAQILWLTLFLTGLGAVSGLLWVVAGDLLGRFLQTESGARWQGRVFGAILLLVALWMIVGNLAAKG